MGMSGIGGKTTAEEAVFNRLPETDPPYRVLVFLTKRGEKTFRNAHTVKPFYKPRFDWEYLRGLLEASMKERLKFETPWIINLAKLTAAEVKRREVPEESGIFIAREILGRMLSEKKLRDFDRNIYTLLAAYLDKVLPTLRKAMVQWSNELHLQNGINVMDLTPWYSNDEVQMLVIRSCMEQILAQENNILLGIPECWKVLPQSRNTPVKLYFEKYIREGATNGNYLMLDSMPGYEVLFIRRNGLVETTTFEALYQQIDSAIQVNGCEETKKTDIIEVLNSGMTRFGWAKLEHIVRHPYSGDLLRINPRAGLIDVSPNHPVMKNPKYIVAADTLRIGDRLCMRRFAEGRFHNNDVQLHIGTAELAWLYGFYVAEGWVNGRHVSFANKNKERLEKAQRIIADNFHLHATFNSPRRDCHCLDLTSPRLVQHMKTLCYTGPKTDKYTKKVPTAILNAPLKIKKAFMEGYIEGDGYKSDDGCMMLVSASRELILGLTWLLHSTHEHCGFTVHIRSDKPRVTQLCVNTGKRNRRWLSQRRVRDAIKKIAKFPYSGYLYDVEVDSKDHTFNMGIGNVRVKNSQDLGGLDKMFLRQVSVWVMGRMQEANEVERLLKQMLGFDVEASKIQTLPLGHFLVACGDQVTKVYVWPNDVPEEMSKRVAKGKLAPEVVKDYLQARTLGTTNTTDRQDNASSQSGAPTLGDAASEVSMKLPE